MAKRGFALARRFPRAGAAMGRARARAVGFARRGASKAAQVAREERHGLTAIGAAGLIGLLKRFAPDALALLRVGPLDETAVLGAALFVIGRMTQNQYAKNGAVGLLSVAVHNLAAGGIEGGDLPGADIIELPEV